MCEGDSSASRPRPVVLIQNAHMSPPNTEHPVTPSSATESAASGADTHAVPFPQRPVAASEPPVHTTPPPEVGTVVGTFVLQEKLGEGVSCHVFRGWDESRS